MQTASSYEYDFKDLRFGLIVKLTLKNRESRGKLGQKELSWGEGVMVPQNFAK
jgi:hypothetical protein